jgi:hypothetical protein
MERAVLAYRPTFAAPVDEKASTPKPSQADRVMAAMARAHPAGDRAGLNEIISAAGVPRYVAIAVRKWARSQGAWPYLNRPGGWGSKAPAAGRKGHAR